jgi:DNA mismatch repair protein MutS
MGSFCIIDKMNTSNETPMLRQYKEIKAKHTDSILFFRLGDFYEMFLDDAKVASKELELTLTGRGKEENRIPMCGIPYHAADSYIGKLVNRGFKVAICEQVEDASLSKGLTKREVVKVITPGTVLGYGHIDEKDNNYLAACSYDKKTSSYGLSYVDISTGEFRVFSVKNTEDVKSHIEKLGAKEILVQDEIALDLPSEILKNSIFALEIDRAEEELKNHFQVQSLSAFGVEKCKQAFPAAWMIIKYLAETQKNAIPQITRITLLQTDKVLQIDKTTARNLELVEPMYGNNPKGTLFGALDNTKTALGARKLKSLLKNPLVSVTKINNRLDAVESLLGDLLSREEIKDTLAQTYDLERLIARIVSEHNNPRDCIALKTSLSSLTELENILAHMNGHILETYTDFFKKYNHEDSTYKKIINLIESSIIENPPQITREGKFIKQGYDKELDELTLSFKNIKDWITNLEEKERTKTGIKSIKVRFNKVFGYYIEIPNSQQHLAPENYIRKQTLTNAERYITPELKEKENIILNGEEKQKELEIVLYKNIVNELKTFVPALQELAAIIANLDCLASFASVAQKYNYTRPSFADQESCTLEIQNGRHPVLERNTSVHYIANDISINKNNNRCILVTGPNMAGKSTIMRQIALTVVMAQIGCFVPADKAEISLVDKLFTRIGALDNLYFGQSTFMVEMLETASILHNATQNSLILLDEIGRGTSTFDGMSLAWAVTDYIHHYIGARTLFATHYHELTHLADKYPAISNYSMQITEEKDNIVFNYKFIPGPADKSYGIHVAKMAGLPVEVIKKADELLLNFEAEAQTNSNKNQQLQLFMN